MREWARARSCLYDVAANQKEWEENDAKVRKKRREREKNLVHL